MNSKTVYHQAKGQFPAQVKIPASYIRGGTSKGVFFKLDDMPKQAQKAGPYRDNLILRVIGSPDPYAKHTDGMGGATSSTSKVVILSKSDKADHEVNYLFAQVAIDKAFVDYSGNCGNLSAAVGAFAIESGIIDPSKLPENGIYSVKIWQENIQKTIVAHIPIASGQVQETGDFELDGVTFPAAEVVLDFLDPAGGDDAETGVLPSGNVVDTLHVPGLGEFEVSYITAGIPTVFLNADTLGYTGRELQEDINTDLQALEKFETIRAHAALHMGLISHIDDAKTRQHTPKIAIVSPACAYTSASNKHIQASEMDLQVRALSMGKLHHAMMGTAAVAIGAAAAIPGTLVNLAAGGGHLESVIFGHPSGTLKVGATATKTSDNWQVSKVSMSRSARILMEGNIRVPLPE